MRFKKVEGIDYKQGAVEYPHKLSPSDRHHLLTKPFYNLAHKHERWPGDGLDEDTHRHFCDFANLAVALALPPGARILDVGCGSGWLSEYFARFGYNVTGIDISPGLIELARQRLESLPFAADHEHGTTYRFLVHDIEAAALDEKFDAIVCYDALHHFADERAVFKHLFAMLPYGGQLFVMEGEQPAEESASGTELRGVMEKYGTLESPYSREYLLTLLHESGFAVAGDYISINGLFDRDSLEGRLLPLMELPSLNYLLCKRLASPGDKMPKSRSPNVLKGELSLRNEFPGVLATGQSFELQIGIKNIGDTLWLVSRFAHRGTVRLGLKIFDEHQQVIAETHGSPALPHALAPGEKVVLHIEGRAPAEPGAYIIKLDLLCQDICWFEERGSTPLELKFVVAPQIGLAE